MEFSYQSDLIVIYRFNVALNDCYFKLKLGKSNTINFKSPDLEHTRRLGKEELANLDKLLGDITLRLPLNTDELAWVLPEIKSELEIYGKDWSIRCLWGNSIECLSEHFVGPLKTLGSYIMEVLPIQNLGSGSECGPQGRRLATCDVSPRE
jgi:hypothetical protein